MPDKSQFEIVLFPRVHHIRFGFVEITYRNPHVHREIELMLVLDGVGCAKYRSQSYPLQKGMLMLINSNEAHDIIATNGRPMKIMYLQISNNYCRDYLQLLHSIAFRSSNITPELPPETNRAIIELMLEAYAHYTDSRPGARLRCMADIFSLLEMLIDNVPYEQVKESEHISSKRFRRLERITDYIDCHYYEKISLAALAEQENVTVSYLSRFIHREIGMTFQDYVSSVRLEKAMMLMNSDMKPIDISVSCGFSDIKYFYATFDRYFGCSPEEYRRNGVEYAGERTEDQLFVTEATAAAWIRRFRTELGSQI